MKHKKKKDEETLTREEKELLRRAHPSRDYPEVPQGSNSFRLIHSLSWVAELHRALLDLRSPYILYVSTLFFENKISQTVFGGIFFANRHPHLASVWPRLYSRLFEDDMVQSLSIWQTIARTCREQIDEMEKKGGNRQPDSGVLKIQARRALQDMAGRRSGGDGH